MAGTITLPTTTVVAGWVTKDLMFLVSGPPLTGPLANYWFHLIVEFSDGTTAYEDDIGQPDAYGRIYARTKDLNPLGGDLIISGLYQGQVNLDDGTINPLINGRCRYTVNNSGKNLMFRIEPQIAQVGSTTNTDAASKTQSGATVSGSAEISLGGKDLPVGGKIGGGVSKPGDQSTNSNSQSQTRNATSVTGLIVTQIPAAPAKK
jgi:hypothetical protein